MLVLWAMLQAASAHMPNIASYTLVEGSPAWELDVSLPTAGMHQALALRHPNEALSVLTVEAYEAYLLDALREGVILSVDNQRISLGEAEVSLAAHETHVRFTVPAPLADVHTVDAHIDALHERGDQNNVFRLITSKGQEHVVLKESNAFHGAIRVVATPSVAAEHPTRPTDRLASWAAGMLMGAGGWGARWLASR